MLDHDIVSHTQGTSATASLETPLPETKRNDATNNTYEQAAPKTVTTIESSSKEVDSQDLDPRGQNRDPKFAARPWIPKKKPRDKYGHEVPKKVIMI